MPNVPGLRSCYAKVGRLVYLGRMLDKIRLHADGRLPAEYHENLGTGFDGRCCTFLRVAYADVVARVRAGDPDQAVLAWAESQAGAAPDEACNIWNRFMMKVGWRDDRTPILRKRVAQFGLENRPIETFFDLLEYDEGRDPVATRAWELRAPLVLVVMGVAGSGKTTVGTLLAGQLGWAFHDADEFHSPANVAKMAAGTPLDDADRAPWLAAIRRAIETTLDRGESAVFTCSALKESYRREIAPGAQVKFVYLEGSFEVLRERLEHRTGHFMRAEMLASQFAALEVPPDALRVDVRLSPAEIVGTIRQAFSW